MTEEQLAEIEARAKSFAKYHAEHEAYGGATREFHARAGSFLAADVPALVAEVRRLRSLHVAIRAATPDACPCCGCSVGGECDLAELWLTLGGRP